MFRRDFMGQAIVVICIGLGFACPPPAAQATSMSLQDFSTATPLFSGGPRDKAIVPNAVVAPTGSELWGPRSDLRSSRADTNSLAFGGSALTALIAEDGSIRAAKFAADYNFDPASLVDWYRFSSDFSFELENYELLDFQAIAIARYQPDVQYWLEGNRWADFDSSLPAFQVPIQDAKDDKTGIGATQQPFSLPTMNTPGNSLGGEKTSRRSSEITRVFSLSEFLLNMIFKLAKLPITYVILSVCIGALVISYYRQPRT